MAEGKSENKKTNSIETCSESKSKIPEGPAVSSWTREQYVDWLKGIGVSYSGAKEDMIKVIGIRPLAPVQNSVSLKLMQRKTLNFVINLPDVENITE